MQNTHTDKYLDVTGVVLAGGKSRRMGTDKARLELAGQSLFERSLELLQSFFATIIIAGDRPDLARPDIPAIPDVYPGALWAGCTPG